MRFFEVFENLQVNSELTADFLQTEVNKVTVSRNTGAVILHIDSTRLITRKNVKKMQSELKKQCFVSLICE